jgi:probable F420-dependent oxidoreductase
MTPLDRLGAYVLPGGPVNINPVIQQAQALEAAGCGTIYVGERYATKDLGAVAGALTQITRRPRIVAAVTHAGMRHPMALASMGHTLQLLSGGRFTLGLGRGSAGRWHAYGLPAPTTEALADTAGILRRLWAGERVSYEGPAGRFPDLQLMERGDAPPPTLLLAGIGPRTLALAGRAFDGAILHPLLTTDAVSRAAEIVRRAAADAGRDPDAMEVHATVITAFERVDEVVGARGLGYLLVDGVGEAIVRANGWDPQALARVRAHPRFAGIDYTQLKSIPVPDLARISTELPEAWLRDGAATGSPERCAERMLDYLASGATHVILHGGDGATVTRVAAILAAGSSA